MLLEIQNTKTEQNDEPSTRKPQSINTRSPLPHLLPLPCIPGLSNGLDNVRVTNTSQHLPSAKSIGEKRKRRESEEDWSEELQENKRPNSTDSSFSRASVSPDKSDLENTFHRRKARTAFSSFQIETLNNAYHENKYQATADRRDLARRLGLTEQQVKNWFQNRRVKDKRHEKEELLRFGGHFPGIDLPRMFTPPFMPQQLVQRLSPNSQMGTPSTPNKTLPTTAVSPITHSPESPSDKVKGASKPQMPLPFPAVPHFFPGYPFMPGFPYPSPLMSGFPFPPFMNSPQFGHMSTPSLYPPMNFKLSN